jgi:alpha-L-rhamnosidase
MKNAFGIARVERGLAAVLLLCGLGLSGCSGRLAGERGIAAGSVRPADLRCEYVPNPLGLDVAEPRLFWKLQSSGRDQLQTAYRILAASSQNGLARDQGDLWDSGKVASGETIQIAYAGRPLQSSQRVFWKVRVWDRQGRVSPWSVPASWTMGLLSQADWQAKWITAERTDRDPLPIFRKAVRLDKSVKQAIIHICGLGHCELTLNGRRVGDREMDPGWTNYRKTCLYSSYDVTTMLQPGDNVIGVMLGNGMYNVPGGRYTKFKGTFGPPKLICRMYVTFADDSGELIASDETWKYAPGPIVFTCIYGGEDYDARREQAGWDRPGFDDKAWSPAVVCDGPGGKLVAEYAPPVKVAERLPAVAIRRLGDGQYEVDCGLNLSARPVIKVKGPAGSQVLIKVAEKRGEPWEKRGGHSYTYTLKGQGEEVFWPRFTSFSFQYLYIYGVDRPGETASGRPLLLDAAGEFLTSSADIVGGFECSNTLFNDIDAMIDRSVRSNLWSVITDCPHREKLGWLEVPHLMGPSILYHYDGYNLYQKICRDTSEAQHDNGLMPNIAPEYTHFKDAFLESPEWGATCVLAPALLRDWYGDQAVIERQYDTMTRYVRYLASTCDANGLVKAGLGDWYDWTEEKGHPGVSQLTPKQLPGMAFLYEDARTLAGMAEKLDRKADAEEFSKLAERVRRDFIRAYYKPAEHLVATGSQASLATALYFGLVPEEDRAQVLANLVAELEKAHYRQSTGEICFRMMVQALADNGRSDVVYKILNRTDPPGYGNMLRLGFKTLSERWDTPGSSMNHCMFGHAQEWFQRSIVGIGQTPDSIAFKRLLLKPEPVGDLTSASGYYDSVRGRIESRWRIENGRFLWHIVVPPNTTAEVHVPTTDAAAVTEGGQPARHTQGVRLSRTEPAQKVAGAIPRAVFEIGSGVYEFESPFVSTHR